MILLQLYNVIDSCFQLDQYLRPSACSPLTSTVSATRLCGILVIWTQFLHYLLHLSVDDHIILPSQIFDYQLLEWSMLHLSNQLNPIDFTDFLLCFVSFNVGVTSSLLPTFHFDFSRCLIPLPVKLHQPRKRISFLKLLIPRFRKSSNWRCQFLA